MAKQNVDVVIKAHDKASKTFKKIGISFKGMMRSIAVGAITKSFSLVSNLISKLIGGIKRLVKWTAVAAAGLATIFSKWAMEAEESENLFRETFGRMSLAVRRWSDKTAEAMGMNAYEMRKNVGVLKLMMENMGLSEKQAIDLGKSLTVLAYDMASFYNLKPEEAFQKIRSGMAGMVMPLQQMGISLHQATIQQWALNNGLIKAGEEMTQQHKVIARYNVLMKATKKAQGDMVRTLGSATNVLRSMYAQIKLVGIEIGNALIPMITNIARKFRDFLKENRDDIVKWAKRIVATLELVGTMFWNFIKFLRTDFKSGFNFVFDAFIEGMKLLANAAVQIGIATGKGIWEGIKKGMGLGSINKREVQYRAEMLMDRARREAEQVQILYTHKGLGKAAADVRPYEHYEKLAKEQLQKEMYKRETQTIMGAIIEGITEESHKSLKKVMEKTPPDLLDAWKKDIDNYKKELDKINRGPRFEGLKKIRDFLQLLIYQPSKVPGAMPGAAAKRAAGRIPSVSALESRFLQLRPGYKFGPEMQTAKNTASTNKQLNKIEKLILRGLRYMSPGAAGRGAAEIIIGTI